jgi:cytochrome b subunit of formate dehydrogenase
MTRYFVRFSSWQRFQHVTVMTLFFLLCLTGLPQKYFASTWAGALITLMGGVDSARWLHRACGLAFTGLLVAHVGDLIVRLVLGRASMAMVPHRKDVADALTTLRYYIGLGRQQARFDRFDYKQKFEYWGMMLGSFVVVGTGLVLLFPIAVTHWLPGSVLPVAVVAHSSEGLLAFLTIITWHIFNAALTPEVFPLDTTVFTGRISEERMRHEHPLELERLTTREPGPPPAVEPGS